MEGARWVVHCKGAIPGREPLSCDDDGSAEKLATNELFQGTRVSKEISLSFWFLLPTAAPLCCLLVCSGALQSRGYVLLQPLHNSTLIIAALHTLL